MRDVEDRQVGLVLARPGRRPRRRRPASATTRRSGFGVEDQPYAAAHQRVVVRQQDPGRSVTRSSGQASRALSRCRRPGRGRRAGGRRPSRARSRIPRMPAPSAAPRSPRAVVGASAAGHRPAVRSSASVDPGGAGVPGDVGQALLGHAVEHQFGLRVRAAAGRWPSSCRTVSPLRPANSVTQRPQRAEQAQLLQHAGTQPAGDAADLVEAPPGRLLHLRAARRAPAAARGRRPA